MIKLRISSVVFREVRLGSRGEVKARARVGPRKALRGGMSTPLLEPLPRFCGRSSPTFDKPATNSLLKYPYEGPGVEPNSPRFTLAIKAFLKTAIKESLNSTEKCGVD